VILAAWQASKKMPVARPNFLPTFVKILLANLAECVTLNVVIFMDKMISQFTAQFAKHRRQAGYSYRGLEEVTGIKYSALAAMQNGHRPVGEQSARRIASAFGLSGEGLESFVLSALNTSRERVLEAVKGYPAEAINLLGLVLMCSEIQPAQIIECDLTQSGPSGCLRLSLKGGRKAHLHVTLSPGA
jgi:transcriptional regulator with XRE-family HTH domain